MSDPGDREHSTPESSFPTNQVIIGLLTTFIGGPMTKSGWDAIAGGGFFDAQWFHGAIEFGAGLMIASLGLSFHWWRRLLSARARAWVRSDSIRWWLPVATVLMF